MTRVIATESPFHEGSRSIAVLKSGWGRRGESFGLEPDPAARGPPRPWPCALSSPSVAPSEAVGERCRRVLSSGAAAVRGQLWGGVPQRPSPAQPARRHQSLAFLWPPGARGTAGFAVCAPRQRRVPAGNATATATGTLPGLLSEPFIFSFAHMLSRLS